MITDVVEEALAVLTAPRGAGPGPDAARDAAFDVLLAAPEIAHPKLLAIAATDHPPPLILLVLAAFGRLDSIPVLATALRDGDAPTSVVAASALARHRLPTAQAALEAALQGTSAQVAIAAAMGLAQRGDGAALPTLHAALAAWPDGEVRARIAETIAALQRP
jgi:HEAT repeat protein